MAAYCAGDGDVDFVPNDRDECPDTPEMTPTFDDGCTDPTLPPTVPRAGIDGLLARTGLVRNKACDGESRPMAPQPTGLCEHGGANVFTLSFQPADTADPDCELWYQLRIESYTPGPDGTVGNAVDQAALAFGPSQLGTGQANPPGGPSDERVDIASLNHFEVFVRVNLRAMNGNGQASEWSGWRLFRPEICGG
jgi:hypothetical protein